MRDIDSLAGLAHSLVMGAWVILLVAALATFTPKLERRRSLILLATGGIFIALTGTTGRPLLPYTFVPGVTCLAAALGLFVWSRHAIRGRLFSYLGSKDLPTFVCTDGPYARIRHPVYTSYLIALIGSCLMFPGPASLSGAALSAIGLNLTARFEEDKFRRSSVAAEYEAYKQRTGRFFPRFGLTR